MGEGKFRNSVLPEFVVRGVAAEGEAGGGAIVVY